MKLIDEAALEKMLSTIDTYHAENAHCKQEEDCPETRLVIMMLEVEEEEE